MPLSRTLRRLHGRPPALLVALIALVALAGFSTVGALVVVPARSAGAATGGAARTVVKTTLVWKWAKTFTTDAGYPIAQSSPTVATLNSGGPSVVVGDGAGRVHALYLTGPNAGTTDPGWPVLTGSPVDSTPSAAVVTPTGYDSIFVGAGTATRFYEGGYEGFGPAGGNRTWETNVVDPTGDGNPAYGVQASLSVGTLQGTGPDVVAGSLDQEQYAMSAASGAILPGWPFFDSDSVFSTASLGDLYGTGQTEIVEGADQSAGFAIGQNYSAGGHIRILNGRGGLICHYDTNQTVDSSPAIGPFLSGGGMGIVVGTGQYFHGVPDTDKVIALNNRCIRQWTVTLDGETTSSPALADVTGNGTLDVVEGTRTGAVSGAGKGSVWVIDAATGVPMWRATTTGQVLGSIVTADLTGDGYQDLLVPTYLGLDIFDGKSHNLVRVLNGTPTVGGHGVLGFQDSPLVTDDPNGTIGITVAGYGCPNPTRKSCKGFVEHYQVEGSTGAKGVGVGSWPEFHHDPQLTGNSDGDPAPGSVPICTVPQAALSGYDMVASDGGVFSFGTTPFCGSTGAIHLNEPVVGMSVAPDTGGYWFAASDGGVFAYGGAPFYGSMGGRPLNSPIVGIAATPDGRGYWLVARDGGIFAFGDAQFYGSTGSLVLTKPVVGMVPSPDGRGYRLVASDGGVFCFGDAQYFGSMGQQPLASPIVGIADDVATAGYWLVGADGGVFAFQAPFYGSMGGKSLSAPIVGISATDNGRGYRFVASDGGVFAFGDTPFYGSMGGRSLNAPIVGMAGF
jgi:hypothetical protein